MLVKLYEYIHTFGFEEDYTQSVVAQMMEIYFYAMK